MKLFIASDDNAKYIAKELAKALDFTFGANGVKITTEKVADGLKLEKTDDGIKIGYADLSCLARAFGLLSRFFASGDTAKEEKRAFGSLGYMVDCSRNAVLSVDGAKWLLQHLAAMGYNFFMLYTEDTYEIKSYPYFGHMRGRYTAEQLREIDDYAASLGIEVAPCIQVLAHLNGAFKWKEMQKFRDIDDVLDISNPETYKLIEEMLKTCRAAFRSKKINLGLDEAHHLGRGKFYDRTHTLPDVSEMMRSHLDKVIKLCEKYDFAPMMWSDMFFRPWAGGYYTANGEMPEEYVKAKPESVTPIYWDYYNENPVVDNMMTQHEKFGCPFAFAGGAWKWIGFAPNNAFSLKLAKNHLENCIKHKVDTVFVTGWGDNGGEASQLSILPTLYLYAECCYGEKYAAEDLKDGFFDTFGISLDDFMKLDLPNCQYNDNMWDHPVTSQCKYMLLNDPLGGLMDKNIDESDGETNKKHAETLSGVKNEKYGYMFDCLAKLCAVLELKSTLSIDIRKAYLAKDKAALRMIANERIDEIIRRVDLFLDAFRRQWYFENKTFGFDYQEITIGGQKERLRSAKKLLNDYCDGKIDKIEELDEPPLDFYGKSADEKGNVHVLLTSFASISTANNVN